MRKLFAWGQRGGYVNSMRYVGVDGCRGGWFAVWLEDDKPGFSVFADFSRLWTSIGDARTILVDMPIGLSGKKAPGRRVDALVRHMLPGRSSSVFTPGVREGLYAASYREACEINRKVSGKGISKQYWNIMPKVKDVDSFLHSTKGACDVVLESHPEVCFQAALGHPLAHAKKTAEGINERLEILCRYLRDAERIYEEALKAFYRKDVARDDILDAMILAVAARESRGTPIPVPDPPERDETGLPMAVWYHDFSTRDEEPQCNTK